jgi:hypothetical protein
VRFAKIDFSAGLNMQFDPTRIAANEYPLLFNGRCRDGVIRPIKKPLEVGNIPAGKCQGIYAANQYALLLCNGRAFIKNYEIPGSAFNPVPDLQMDANVETIFAEAIPASTRNFTREPVSASKNDGVNLTAPLGQTPAAVLLQDGLTQPWVIKADGTARITKRYDEWTRENPEYVPIGKQMLHDNGILYIVSPDGTLIYRMVTDQPLNGMVNITSPDGGKQATEADGGAATVSHAIGFEPISCLAALNTPDNAFFAGTRKLGAMVVPDFADTIFGEPIFDNLDLFSVGPVNQFSFAETNGDYLFVTTKGIRSFNATRSLTYESRNEPFSRRIQRLFKNVTQTNPAIGKWDDYLFLSVATVYGNAVIVYDETLNTFVSVDQYANVARVKQFATVVTSSGETLLFITEDNRLYEFAAGETSEQASLYVGDFVPETPEANQSPQMLYVSIENAEDAGTLTVTPFIDRKRQANSILSEPINSNRAPDALPLTVPFGDYSRTNTQVIAFEVGRVEQGRKVGFLLSLDTQADISAVALVSGDEAPQAGLKNEVARWARLNGVVA